jgi:hypothetical protein
MVINEVTFRLGINVGLMMWGNSSRVSTFSLLIATSQPIGRHSLHGSAQYSSQHSTAYPSRPMKFVLKAGNSDTSRGVVLQTLQSETLSNPSIDTTWAVGDGDNVYDWFKFNTHAQWVRTNDANPQRVTNLTIWCNSPNLSKECQVGKRKADSSIRIGTFRR